MANGAAGDEAALEAIRAELRRIQADATGAGPDSIGVNDEGDGWASLGATPDRADFYWYGLAGEILRRLRSIPSATGPAGVRTEFHVNLPPELRRGGGPAGGSSGPAPGPVLPPRRLE